MAPKTRIVTLMAYYHTSHVGRVTIVLADLMAVGATCDTLNEAIESVKTKLREWAAECAEIGTDVPWKVRAPRPAGWDTLVLRVRLGPKPVIRWHHRAVTALLYAGGWLLVRGIHAIEQLAEKLESYRRKS